MEQRSPEWFAARCGKVTASKLSALGDAYLYQLVAERLTGEVEEGYSNAAMRHGVVMEPIAQIAYEIKTGNIITPVGFVHHPTILMSGASPDGLVDDDGLIEIKCPSSKTHIETLIKEDGHSKYMAQMQWQMACTGRQWVDFISYDQRIEGQDLYIKRIARDDEQIAALEEKVLKFLEKVEATLEKIKSRKGPGE